MATACGHCGAAGAEARCSKCKQELYCGRECQVAGWKAHKAVCKERQQEAELAEMEAHIAGLDAACGGGLGKLKGKKRREKMAEDLAQTAPQAAAAAAAVNAHNRTTQAMLKHMASGAFGDVVAMKEDVLEAIKTLELMGKNGPALGLLSDLGTAHRNLGEHEAAVTVYQQAIDFLNMNSGMQACMHAYVYSMRMHACVRVHACVCVHACIACVCMHAYACYTRMHAQPKP